MIRVDQLCKSYGAVEALRDVSFETDGGEVVGVLGLNGAGKSTLLRILAGELAASSGSVTVDRLDLLCEARQVRARVGYLPEGSPLYRDMTVRRLLRFVLDLHGGATTSASARIEEVAGLTHVREALDRVVGQLSMGFRKRVGIAAAIIHEPSVVILDEPISSLDPAEIVGMRELVRSLGRRHTVLVSSHILSEVEETCDRILVLHEGRLVGQGTEDELRGQADAGVDLELDLRGDGGALPALVAPWGRLEEVRQDGELLWATVHLATDRREGLIAALVAAGFGIRGARVRRSDLERVFLSIVGARAHGEVSP